MVGLTLHASIEECLARTTTGIRCVLIGGPSGAGKSTVASLLALRLGCGVLELDDFYVDLDHVPEVDIGGELWPMWDCPEAVDVSLALDTIIAVVLEGRSCVRVPVYSFQTNTRSGTKWLAVPGGQHLIVEGALAHLLREGCTADGIPNLAMYVDAEWDLRLRRIRERDRSQPRRALESEHVDASRLLAMATGEQRWILPMRAEADIVVRSESSP